MATGGRYRNQGDLITKALANLGVLSPGQPVDVEDSKYVSDELDSIYRKLAGLEICTVTDPNNIDGTWFTDLADIVAGECATKFGVDADTFQKLTAKGLGVPPGSGAAALSLKAINRGRPTYERLRVEYF
jgi:hypothetical protein